MDLKTAPDSTLVLVLTLIQEALEVREPGGASRLDTIQTPKLIASGVLAVTLAVQNEVPVGVQVWEQAPIWTNITEKFINLRIQYLRYPDEVKQVDYLQWGITHFKNLDGTASISVTTTERDQLFSILPKCGFYLSLGLYKQ